MRTSENIETDCLARQLTNIERPIFYHGFDFSQLLPFFRYSSKLKAVVFNSFEGEAVNLFAVHKEREKLRAKQIVTIYASESDYLKTKWDSKNLNLKLVEIARINRIKHYFRILLV